MKKELRKNENMLNLSQPSELMTAEATVVETGESEGLASTLLLVTICMLLILLGVIVAMCCYIRSQKRQRLNAREVEERSAQRF